MKLVEVNVVGEEFDAIELIRKKVNFECKDEPMFVCNVSDIVNKYHTWIEHMPRVVPFYAVKCNDSMVVLQTLASLGARFDCASRVEIGKVMELGVPAESIIYANPAKPMSHLEYAAKHDVKMMTFDCDFELYKIQKCFPKAELVLRIRCDARVAQCPLGEKFGCDPVIEAPALIRLAKSLNMNLIGISFHVGSGCQDIPIYGEAIATARKLFDFAESVGFNLRLLDIGGGFPGDKDTDIAPIASVVNRSLDMHFASPEVTVIAEPGRFFVSSAYTLITRIHAKRHVYRNGDLHDVMYYINDGVYGSFNCNLYDHYTAHPIAFDKGYDMLFSSSVWGPTCDALDQVCKNVMLPDLNVNDALVFENMGAYTIPISSPFNGFPLPKVEYYIERKQLEDINSTTSSHEYILLDDN